MSRIIEELVNNPSLLEHYKKKPEYNLVIAPSLSSHLCKLSDAYIMPFGGLNKLRS